MSLVDVIVMLVIFQVYYFQYDLNGNSYKLYCKNKYLGRHSFWNAVLKDYSLIFITYTKSYLPNAQKFVCETQDLMLTCIPNMSSINPKI